MKKAIVAMSGGVDSSVAALFMKEQGYECIGATMKLYDNEDIGIDREKTCCSLDDIEDARAVAYKLGMPYYVFNFKDEFEHKVIDKFISTYEAGGTPNPCIDCNRYLKFEKLMKRMEELQYDCVVTGHYADIEYVNGRYMLKKGKDLSKDQSYVLYSLTQYQLEHTVFPLGKYSKDEIREVAEKNGFINAKKRDSQDICFVPDGDYSKFIEQYKGKTYPSGDFVDKQGNVLGKHNGLIRYTIGQRKGLNIALGHPVYVISKDIESNTVVLGSNDDLNKKSLVARDFNWIAQKPDEKISCCAKTRYNMREVPCVAYCNDDKVIVEFDEPVRAITPGQAVVLYDGDYVLGGGTIE
ncbi:tRNA 2-thiouridine(34) synthase MnmA [uncultured Eubacterium sp.]|uniref:tRNA 2-thiouridine(34) synthase MnmA n=1 Tax=uncultured Eubacterium sp. TaxID=165185 RepID=UPI0025D81946|nr:tRNA 2-thiouridine(34) synthase MnmA [uncultured Eubacterium sp.]